MEKIDNTILHGLQFITEEEQKAIMKLLSIKRADPHMMILMAIFRDTYMHRQMVNATMIKQRSEIAGIKQDIQDIRDVIDTLLDELEKN